MRVVVNFASVRGDGNDRYSIGDVFDASEERAAELIALGAVSPVGDEVHLRTPGAPVDTEIIVTRRGPGRPRKH